MTADNPQAFSLLVEPVKASRDSQLTPSVRVYDLRDGWHKIPWVLKKCANRNVLGSYYVPAEFLFW